MNSGGLIAPCLLLYIAFYISFTCISFQLVETSSRLGAMGTREHGCKPSVMGYVCAWGAFLHPQLGLVPLNRPARGKAEPAPCLRTHFETFLKGHGCWRCRKCTWKPVAYICPLLFSCPRPDLQPAKVKERIFTACGGFHILRRWCDAGKLLHALGVCILEKSSTAHFSGAAVQGHGNQCWGRKHGYNYAAKLKATTEMGTFQWNAGSMRL